MARRERPESTLQDLPETVRTYLRKVGAGAEEISLAALAGDASDRTYLRLHLHPAPAGTPDTYVLMRLSQPWEPGDDRKELPYVNIGRHLAACGVPVPGLHVDAARTGCLLLEDVGDETLQDRLASCDDAERTALYEEALDILVRIQARGTEAGGGDCQALRYAFDEETFLRELRFFRTHALEGLWENRLDEADRQEVDRHFQLVCRRACEGPQVLTHRDYHSRNLMVRGGGLVVLDFQDARLGPPAYDLVSLLRDAYVRLDVGEEERLKGSYLRKARAAGLHIDEGPAFEEGYTLAAVQRNLKAIGTFSFQARVLGVDRYLPYIPDTLASARRAMDAHGELAPLRRCLDRFLPGP